MMRTPSALQHQVLVPSLSDVMGSSRLCGLSAVNQKNQVNGSYEESLSFCL
jgi:hypothetical protein